MQFIEFLASTYGPWTPYLYQYGVGGFFFFLAILVARVKGVWSFERPADRRTILMLVAGFVFYAGLHGLWIYWAQASR